MIIRSIKAEGFMKYEHLELTELPLGAIAVEGENEAGKTTLGEAIAFGLFGRTVRTEETDPSQAIHWDSERAATTVEFELKNAGNNGELAHREEGIYKIERTIERSGHSEARLTSPRGQLLGGSFREVAKALQRVLGFSFPEFRYSFYVAQKELDLVRHATRDNTRRIIYDMLGITAVERARALVQRELEESKERSRTLERDLVVARALLNEAQGDREHGDTALKDHESAESEAAQAATVEETARAARERATTLTDARRDALTSFGRLEGAIVLGTQRAHLAAARHDLANAEKAAQGHAEKAQSVLQQGERPRADAKAALEKARATREAARALAAVVDARSAQLKSELAAAEGHGAAGSGLSLGERTARETERSQRLQTKAGRRMLLSVVLLLFGVVLGAGAAGMLLPDAEKPFLGQFYKGDKSVDLLGHTIALTHFVMALILGGLGSVSIVWSFFTFVGRRALTSEIRESEGDLEKLSGAVTKLKADLASYEGFDTKRLRDVEVKAKRIDDQAVARALQGFKDAAQGADQSDLSADGAVEEAQKRLDQLEKDRSGAEPRFQEASRIQRGAKRALDLADAAMGDAAKGRESATDELVGLDLAALEQRFEQAAAQAARARIEIEALQAAGQDGTVPEAGRALNEALARIYEARPEAKGVYEQQTGLRALLDALRAGTLPSPEDLRDTLKREREVLRQALGTEEESRTLLAQAEEAYRRARDNRARLESRLAEARARGERAQIGRSRSAELEVKVAGLEDVLGPIAHELAVHEECLRLQEDLIKAMKSRFGPGIARYIEVILPRLTGGRYKRTRIDEELDLRVFSNERGDFVRLVDISFGTADQVLLALRLGLARALVASRGLHGAHFLFLDEPLASADESRGQAFLELLRSFDDEFAQVFVTSTRPLEGSFSKRINLQTATRVLKV